MSYGNHGPNVDLATCSLIYPSHSHSIELFAREERHGLEMKIGFYSFHVNLALHDVVWIALGAGVKDGMFKVIDSVILANLL